MLPTPEVGGQWHAPAEDLPSSAEVLAMLVSLQCWFPCNAGFLAMPKITSE
jgi:hypothetical protein